MLNIIREITYICCVSNIQIMAVHIPGVTNRRADELSRAPVNPNCDLDSIMGPGSTRLEVNDELFVIPER